MRQGVLILAVGRVRSKYVNETERKTRKNPAAPKTHHEINHSKKATATTSRRRAVKHVPRVSPYSHSSSIDPRFVEISLACIHTYPHCCCCYAACIRFGALFSRQRGFFFLYYCGRYLRFRDCLVVLEIKLSVSACYQRTPRVLLRARRLLLLLLLLLAAERGGVRYAA